MPCKLDHHKTAAILPEESRDEKKIVFVSNFDIKFIFLFVKRRMI